MTPAESIEVQEQSLQDDQFFLPDDLQEAMRLGIEALKRILHIRTIPHNWTNTDLPGETN